jgi:hypothetical protein
VNQPQNQAVEFVARVEPVKDIGLGADWDVPAHFGHRALAADAQVVVDPRIAPAGDEVQPRIAIAAEQKAGIQIVAEHLGRALHIDRAAGQARKGNQQRLLGVHIDKRDGQHRIVERICLEPHVVASQPEEPVADARALALVEPEAQVQAAAGLHLARLSAVAKQNLGGGQDAGFCRIDDGGVAGGDQRGQVAAFAPPQEQFESGPPEWFSAAHFVALRPEIAAACAARRTAAAGTAGIARRPIGVGIAAWCMAARGIAVAEGHALVS